ncbi:MAG: glucodextranase DOMON-like domain-containing protein, partial [Thermoplasmata archaeon]
YVANLNPGDYRLSNITDKHLSLAFNTSLDDIPPKDFSEGSAWMLRATAQFEFFWNPNWTRNTPKYNASSYYSYLYNKTLHELYPRNSPKNPKIGDDRPLPKGEFIDLKVLFMLFQHSFWYVYGNYSPDEYDARMVEIIERNWKDPRYKLPDGTYSVYNYNDLQYLYEKQIQTMAKLRDEFLKTAYNATTGTGQNEFTTTPFYHPIMPLLMKDSWSSGNGVKTWTVNKGSWPEDVAAHLQKGAQYYQKWFNQPVYGLWPSEESVAQNIIEPVYDAGFRWMVTDRMVLENSLQKWPVSAEELYHPWIASSGGKDVVVLFRDRNIADAIAFTYQSWDAKKAVADLIGNLERVKASLSKPNESLVTLALDGENWMFMGDPCYPENGRIILDTLYSMLENTSWIRTVTVREYLSEHPPTRRLTNLAEGSWINGDLTTWSLEEDEDNAWKALAAARKAIKDYEAAHPDEIGSEKLKKAWETLYIAEGSDWYWWYGLDQDSGFDELWDQAFKRYIAAIYEILQQQSAVVEHPFKVAIDPSVRGGELITPIVDGSDIPGEWEGADIYTESPCTGGGELAIRSMAVVYSPTTLYIQLKFGVSAKTLINKYNDISVYVSSLNPEDNNQLGVNFLTRYSDQELNFPGLYRFSVSLTAAMTNGKTKWVKFMASEDMPWSEYMYESEFGTAWLDDVVEIAIPLGEIGLSEGNYVYLRAAAVNKTTPSRNCTFPHAGPVQVYMPKGLFTPILLYEGNDTVGDENGAGGNVTYPTSEKFANPDGTVGGLFDITKFRIEMTDFNVIFRITFASMTNVWNLQYGFSHQAINIYIDQDRITNSGAIEMLEGPRAAVTPDFAWEVAVAARGDKAFAMLYNNITGKQSFADTGMSVEGDLATKTVTVYVPKSIAGSNPAAYGYVLVVGSQDGFGLGMSKFRLINAKAETWRLGGGADDPAADPNIVDAFLGPNETRQASILAGWSGTVGGEHTYAAVPGITIPAIEQQVYGTRVIYRTGTSFLVSSSTTQPASSQVEYWTEGGEHKTTPEDATPKTSHQVCIAGISQGAKVYFKVISKDSSGTYTSDVYSVVLKNTADSG